MFGRGAAAVRIVAASEIGPLVWGVNPDSGGNFGPGGRIWRRLARLTDGSWLAVNLDVNRHNALWQERPDLRERLKALGGDRFAPLCRGANDTRNCPGANPVVALSSTQLLESLPDSGGKPAALAPEFAGYGGAELFTRRE